VLTLARPYRRQLIGFVITVILAAVISAVPPLILRALIDTAIPQKDRQLVGFLAFGAVFLALFNAGLTLIQRYYSARIGEGLIFDMRTALFDHVQHQPLSFFTRTQTGALVTRLNNDVLGAQQAFTDTLSSVVSNLITVSIVLVTMLLLNWQITLVALSLLPVFVLPARWVGRRLQSITRESYGLNAQMNTTMTERFNVSGALLVKLFGRQDEERRGFEAKAARVRDIGITQAMYSRVFMTSLLLVASLTGQPQGTPPQTLQRDFALVNPKTIVSFSVRDSDA